MEHNAFTFSSWNIQGLRSSSSAFGLKSRNTDFIKEIANTDIVILQETWFKEDGPTGCHLGYRELAVPSTKLPGVKQGRESGGMLIWYRADLTHSIKFVKTGTFYIWLEMNKEIISTETNGLMCATYIPPLESPYFNEDSFSILEGEINNFQARGHVLVCGNLNTRTGQEPDSLSTQGDKHLPGGDSIHSPICPILYLFLFNLYLTG
jgi:exonuclease III